MAIVRQKRSILDFIAERTRALQQELGPGDKVLLDGYLDNVREIERRVQLAQNHDLSGVKVPETPLAEQDTFEYFVDHCLMRPQFLINIIENAIANGI